jgi:dTMP kinase
VTKALGAPAPKSSAPDPSRGLFIVFEGIEGCGKSTQAGLFAERLIRAGIPHVLTREPGGTAVGEQIRSVVLHGHDLPSETELLLVLAARAAHVQQVIRPGLQSGQIVVSDRYELSSLAYQGIGRGLGVDRVKVLNAFATGGLRPDLTVVCDVPVNLGDARRSVARSSSDRIERAGADFHERVAEAYRLLANQDGQTELVDGADSADMVSQAIIEVLARRFPETFGRLAG